MMDLSGSSFLLPELHLVSEGGPRKNPERRLKVKLAEDVDRLERELRKITRVDRSLLQCLLFLVPEFTGGGSTEEAFKHLEMLYSDRGLKSLTLLAAPERVLVWGPARLPSPHFG
ncbi:hypothetical protein MHYP_G00245080 [Metynnis hypsauchen]